MIPILNKDRVLFDLPYRIIDMIREYQSTGSITLSTNGEGIDLNMTDLYQILDYLCLQLNIKKSAISLRSWNSIENHATYQIISKGNHWIKLAHNQIYISKKAEKLSHIGSFVGKPNWHRLVMGAWLHANYRDKILQTLHYNHLDERHRIDSELTEISRETNLSELRSVVNFMSECPLTLSEGFINYTIGPDVHYQILSEYPNIFLDLVTETYVSGSTFFPTEKTFRPIIASTPFIIMGPPGFLTRMHQLGFRSFADWWDESYDLLSAYDRICKIREVLTAIFEWPIERLHQILTEMQPVLAHNKTLLSTVTSLDFTYVK